jgi:hypothetical protein
MRLKLICAVLVAFVLVIAPGCGSKKKAASTTPPATTTSQATTPASGGAKLTGSDCANLVAAEQTVANATSGKIPTDLNSQVARMKALAKVVPADIRPDFEALAAAAAKLSKLGLKPNVTPTAKQLQALMSELNVAQLSAAAQHIGAWAQANCTTK